jgi:hypothetical protein
MLESEILDEICALRALARTRASKDKNDGGVVLREQRLLRLWGNDFDDGGWRHSAECAACPWRLQQRWLDLSGDAREEAAGAYSDARLEGSTSLRVVVFRPGALSLSDHAIEEIRSAAEDEDEGPELDLILARCGRRARGGVDFRGRLLCQWPLETLGRHTVG